VSTRRYTSWRARGISRTSSQPGHPKLTMHRPASLTGSTAGSAL